MVDAIALEKAEVPAVIVTTTKFKPIAETLSEQFGLKDTRMLVLPHPIGGTERERLHRWADAGAVRVIAVVTTGTRSTSAIPLKSEVAPKLFSASAREASGTRRPSTE